MQHEIVVNFRVVDLICFDNEIEIRSDHKRFILRTISLILTQRSGLKFIRFLFPLPLPRFEESTEGREFAFSFQGRRSRA